MIEKLENCPNCGAVLDDTGRCQYCGSKVYDLFDVDISGAKGIKYLRIRTKDGLIVAPIVCNTLNYECQYDHIYCDDGIVLRNRFPRATISMEFSVMGDVIHYAKEE